MENNGEEKTILDIFAKIVDSLHEDIFNCINIEFYKPGFSNTWSEIVQDLYAQFYFEKRFFAVGDLLIKWW